MDRLAADRIAKVNNAMRKVWVLQAGKHRVFLQMEDSIPKMIDTRTVHRSSEQTNA